MSLRAWRICKAKHARNAFDGEGAYLYGGRWNSPGFRAVYLGGSPGITALEMIVHTDDPEDLYRMPYVLIPVDFDPSWIIRPAHLPPDWKQDPSPQSTASIGDAWIAQGTSLILEVPSAVIVIEKNYILNPVHADFPRLKIGKPEPFEFDSRLGKLWPRIGN